MLNDVVTDYVLTTNNNSLDSKFSRNFFHSALNIQTRIMQNVYGQIKFQKDFYAIWRRASCTPLKHRESQH